MSDYVPLTLKYRPQYFRDLVGQEVPARTIQNMLRAERVHPSLIFGGSRGTGKCVRGDTFVWSASGLDEIDHFFDGEWGLKDLNTPIAGKDGWDSSVAFYSQPSVSTKLLKFASGRELEGTPVHRIWTVNSQWDWEFLGKMQEGSYVPLFLGGPELFDGEDSLEDLEMLGYLVGDSSYTEKGRVQICCAGKESLEWVSDWLSSKGWDFVVYRDLRRDALWNVHCKEFEFLKWLHGKWQIGYVSSPFKTIPRSVTRLHRKCISAFVRGLWQADGYCAGNNEIGMASKKLILQLQEILRYLGVMTTYISKFNSKYQRDYHYLYVVSWESHQLLREIVGKKIPSSGNLDSVASGLKNSMSDRDIVPVGHGDLFRIKHSRSWDRSYKSIYWIQRLERGTENLTKERLSAILSEFRRAGVNYPEYFNSLVSRDIRWDRIESVEDSVCDVFDFTIPGRESFIGNGYENHNTTTARIVARALNCEQRTKDCEPCGQCKTCLEILDETSWAVQEIDAASHGSVDDIRTIKSELNYTNLAGQYRVWVIDECHALSSQAWQAFLKLLEEPPPRVVFVFCSTETSKIPETIASRSMNFAFSRLTAETIVSRLRFIAEKEMLNVSAEALVAISRSVNGGMRDAISLLDQLITYSQGEVTPKQVQEVLGVLPRDMFFSLAEALVKRQVPEVYRLLQDVYRQISDVGAFLRDFLLFYRDMVLVKLNVNDPDVQADYRKSAESFTSSLPIEYLVQVQTQIQHLIDQVHRANLPARAVVDAGMVYLIYGGVQQTQAPVQQVKVQEPVKKSLSVEEAATLLQGTISG